MAYRRDKEEGQRWKRWLRRHQEELLRLSMPPFLYSAEKHWVYFLEHGYNPLDPTRFYLVNISFRQKPPGTVKEKSPVCLDLLLRGWVCPIMRSSPSGGAMADLVQKWCTRTWSQALWVCYM